MSTPTGGATGGLSFSCCKAGEMLAFYRLGIKRVVLGTRDGGVPQAGQHDAHKHIHEGGQRRRGRPHASARADALSLPDQDLPAQLRCAGVHAPPRAASCCRRGWPRLLLVHGRAGGVTGAGRAVPQGPCGDVPRVPARCSAGHKAQRRNPAATAPLTAQSAPCGARAPQTAAAAARPARHELQRALLAARLLEPAVW